MIDASPTRNKPVRKPLEYRTQAAKKAAVAGHCCRHIRQYANKSECESYIRHDVWPEAWGSQTTAKAKRKSTTLQSITPSVEPAPISFKPLDIPAQLNEPLEVITGAPPKVPLEVHKKPKAHKGMLANGRTDKAAIPSYEKIFCQVYQHEMEYPAWHNLNGSAFIVYLVCRAKSGNAGSKGKKDSTGKPCFTFTHFEAQDSYNISGPTFTNALKQLVANGFIEISRSSGVFDGKGIPQLYRLSGQWKKFVTTKKPESNLKKMWAGKKQNKFLSKSPLDAL